jgi:hypothetical protein
MKKYILILGIFWLCCSGVFGQLIVNKPVDNTISLGIKGGVNMPRMLYFSNPALMRLPQSFVFMPTGGVFLDIPITEAICLSPEVVYVQRGTDTRYVHRSGAKVHYSISTSYIDLRIPLEWAWEVNPFFQPFVAVGAEAGMCLFGQMHIDREIAPDPYGITMDQTIGIDSANMFLIHAGAYAGVGIRSKVSIGYQDVLLKFNVSFHQGVIDSYSPYEKNGTAQAVNVNAYQVTGYRLPQGLEITLGIAIPLKPRLKDSCASFSNDRHRRHSNRRHLYGY